MLKNKFKTIVLVMLLMISLIVPISLAENTEVEPKSNTENQEAIQNQATAQNISEATMKKGDVYLTGDTVTIDYVVDGNVFVFANTVNINSQIGGDAFIFANNVNVSKDGYIFSNLFAASKTVNISGVVYDLYTSANAVNIDGYIYRDVRISSNILTISGVIGRNAYVSSNSISFPENSEGESQVTSKGSIGGDLNYSAKSEITVPEGSVAGKVNYSPIKNSGGVPIQNYILGLGKFIVTVLILWLLYLWLSPKFLEQTGTLLSKKFLSVVGYSILTPIIFIIGFVLLLILGLTSNIALIATLAFGLLLLLSTSTLVIAINNIICEKFKVTKKSAIMGILIITSTVVWLLHIIPVVGKFISIIMNLIGLGLIVTTIFIKKEVSAKNTSSKTNKKSSKK